MLKNNSSAYEQSYNVQAVVDADGTMLVLGARVVNIGPDAGQLALDVEAVSEEVADSGQGGLGRHGATDRLGNTKA